MDDRLRKEIENHSVGVINQNGQGNGKIPTKSSGSIVSGSGSQMSKGSTPLTSNDGILNSNNGEGVFIPGTDKPQKFFRSQRNIQMKIRDSYEQQLAQLESEKLQIIQRLNDALVALDKLNQEKSQLSQNLIDQIKFVRDMQRETHKCEDISGVVSDELKQELRVEKERSMQMKEALKEAEAQRVMILQRIHELQSLKDDGERQHSDMTINLGYKHKTYGELEEEYKDIRDRIRLTEDQCDSIKAMLIAQNETILKLRNQVDETFSERQGLVEKIRVLQDRFDSSVATFSKERHDIDNMHKRHLKMLSSSNLFFSLQSLLNQNLQFHFNTLSHHTVTLSKLSKGFKLIKTLSKKNRLRVLNSNLHKWHHNALNPFSLKTLITPQITPTLSKHRPAHKCFYLWLNQFQIKQSQKALKREILQRFINVKERYHRRELRLCLDKWRDNVKNYEEFKKKRLFGFILKKHRCYLKYALSNWIQANHHLNEQIQLNHMAQRLGHRKYLATVFMGWRRVSTDLKNRKYSILNRTFKNLKAHTMMRKQMKRQVWSILREQKLLQTSIVKQCFYALRLNKEQEKHVKVTQILFDKEIPQREKTLQTLFKIAKIDNFRYKSQALSAISRALSRKVFSYFRHWQGLTREKRVFVGERLGIRVLRGYLLRMREAFFKWQKYRNQRVIQSYTQEISNQENCQKELIEQIKEDKNHLQERTQRLKCQSTKSIRKVLESIIHKQLYDKFLQWKLASTQETRKQEIIKKISMRIDREKKRKAFWEYKDRVIDIRKYLWQSRQAEDIRLKLQERDKLRVFQAIRMFSTNHSNAKRYMHRLITRLDVSLKDSTFKTWHKTAQTLTESLLMSNQTQKVQQIKEISQNLHERQDELEEIVQQNKRLKKSLENNGKRIIRHGFQRCFQQSQEYYFAQWLDKVLQIRKRDLIIKRTLNHIEKLSLQFSFLKWKKQTHQQMFMVYEEAISEEGQKIENIQNQSGKQSNKFLEERDQFIIKIQNLNQIQDKLQSNYNNCVKTLINRVETLDSMPKKRFIFQQWLKYLRNRKRFVGVMEKCITKNMWSQGFKKIQRHSKEVREDQGIEEKCLIIAQKFYKVKLRQCFKDWHSHNTLKVKSITDKINNELDNLNKNHSKFRKNVQGRIEEQIMEHTFYIKKFDVFIGWKNFIQSQKQLKHKIAFFKEEQIQREQQRALQKWNTNLKIKLRRTIQLNKLCSFQNKSLIQQSFAALRQSTLQSKNLCQKLSNLGTVVDKVYLLRAFQAVKLESEARGFNKVSSKLRGTEVLLKVMEGNLRSKKSQTLTFLRNYNTINQKLHLGQKAIIKYYMTKKIREYFNQWKQSSDKDQLVKYMNEEGPIAIQNHNLKKMLYNLKLVAMRDGIKEKKIDKLLNQDKRNSIRLIEKSVCRIFCYKDNDLYLLPKCLDQWKQWVKHRKLFRYWLNYLDKRVDPGLNPLFHAFRKWKLIDYERKKQLNAMKKQELEQICIKNHQVLDSLAKDFEIGSDTVKDLTGQRDQLLKKYVSSQRLALAVTNSQSERAQFRTLSKWVSNVGSDNSSLLEDALKQNLLKIQQLKDRIKYFEKSNNHLADQNEELRQNALDGIEMAKSVDDLTREREKLSVDLADKAIIIRKLLEDNNNLSVRLSNAQEEAQNLIKISQMKISGNGMMMTGMDSLY